MSNRRNFLKATGLGIAAATIPGVAGAGCAVQQPSNNKNYKFKLGVASYSLRKFTTEEALDMTKRLNISRIAFKSYHLALDASKEEIEKTLDLCNQKGVTLYGGGVIYMKNKAEVDNAFEYAKAAGMKIIIGVPAHEILEYVETKVKEYDIKLAIHNHGPGDKLYPSAESAYNLVKDMDSRMGLCIDIGHTKRINRDPEQDLVDFFDRVHDIHIKDVTAPNKDGSTCEIGRGVIDIVSFIKAVIKSGYDGTLGLEFEKDGNDPLAGMAESIGYVKGVLATL